MTRRPPIVTLALLAAGAAWLWSRRARTAAEVAPDLRSPLTAFRSPGLVPALLPLLAPASRRARPLPPGLGVRVETRVIPGAGHERRTVHLYFPQGRSGVTPALLYVHGGGFVLGSAATDHRVCAEFAADLGVLVLSPDYCLAPKAPFPAALDDVHAALSWLGEHAAELGIDPARIAVVGHSAGGGLAASVAQRARDHGGIQPAFQALIYPMLDDRTTLRAPGTRGELVWTPTSNRTGWSAYLGRAPTPGPLPPHAAAARCGDLRGLPPAWIGVGTLDLFHRENLDYARRLEAAGVPCETVEVPGAYHGFDRLRPGAPSSRRFRASLLDALRRALGLGPAPLDVLIVGAGLSGIGAARHLLARNPARRLEILEGRRAVGGTWDLFRYPGVRSDSDVFTLGYSFKPWRGRESVARGEDIRRYIAQAADEAGVTGRVRFGHRVVRAAWSTEAALWTVTAEADGGTVTRQTRFLLLCSGYYRFERGHRPDFPGERDFRGAVVHPQFWPQDLDWAGRRVVVIGSGATAVTLVPALAEGGAAHVTMLQRSPSDVAVRPLVDPAAVWLQRRLPPGAAHRVIRWKNILSSMFYFGIARRRPDVFRRALLQAAREHAGDALDPRDFTPRYRPWDQRVCVSPDGDLFRAMRGGRAAVVTGEIETFTPGGVRLVSGEELPADVIVTATGLQMNALGDIRFTVDGQPLDPARALVYKGMMLSGVPNAAYAFGYTNASWTLKVELTADWVARLLERMDRRGDRVVYPQPDPSVPERPLLDFSSGYVARSAHLLPRQGARPPWRVHQNYLLDAWTIRLGRLDDGTLRFGAARPRRR